MTAIVEMREEFARALSALGTDPHGVLMSMSDQVVILDPRQRALAVAGGWPYGTPPRPDGLIGRRFTHAFGPQAAAAHEAACARALRGESVAYEWTIANSRQVVRLSSVASPLRTGSAKVAGLVIVTRNITPVSGDERRLAESIAEKTRQLQALEQGVRQLTQVIESYRGRDTSPQRPQGSRLGGSLQELSAREQDVLRLLREGYRPRSIAEILGVSPQTVRNHLKAIFKKTGTHSQEELITLSRRAAS
jgi:DNA-binding CsgD family transcriptional regulator